MGSHAILSLAKVQIYEFGKLRSSIVRTIRQDPHAYTVRRTHSLKSLQFITTRVWQALAHLVETNKLPEVIMSKPVDEQTCIGNKGAMHTYKLPKRLISDLSVIAMAVQHYIGQQLCDNRGTYMCI